ALSCVLNSAEVSSESFKSGDLFNEVERLEFRENVSDFGNNFVGAIKLHAPA
ncbi:MAG: hypothetical protein JWQ00_3129, partial [Noviherbaspirillum sp.]|nr:hypothetical protein [Noviherbaspirillum sp.]